MIAQKRATSCLLAGVTLVAILAAPVMAWSAGFGAIGDRSVSAILLRWLPLILLGPQGEFGGFVLNIAVSFLAMGIGTFLGLLLGITQTSLIRVIRIFAWSITQFFRNSPWLVLLFFVIMLLPFDAHIGPLAIALPAWLKATLGLSLAIMGNVSEIVRGAIQSIPTNQWESAESLSFSRRQTLFEIILPQCITRGLPPWMNLY